MQCNSCGAVLPPGAKHCPACGAPAFDPGPFQESVSLPPSPDLHSARTIPGYTPSQPVEWPQPDPSPERTFPAEVYTPPQPVNNYGPPAYQQPPFYPSSQQPGYPQSPLPLQQQPNRRGGLSRGMIILLIVLALLFMSSGIGLIYYSTVYHPAQLHAQATATVQTSQTKEAQGTATANTQATGTAVAFANATATAQAQATAQVQATATALQNIYTSATSGSPALADSLAANSGSGWDEDLAQGGGGCGFAGGAYHASLYSKGFYFPCFAQNTNFSNFAYQVQMTIARGDNGGIIFRANSTTSKFYVFRLGSDGTYDLFVSQDNNHTTELSYGNNPAIHKNAGHSNLLTVVARGSNLYLYINKQYVVSVSDNTYKTGQIGVFAEDHTNPTDVAFSNVQVWRL